MWKSYLLIPLVYLAYAWQAALRHDIGWQGYSPNFLVLALIVLLWSSSDVMALAGIALLGLLSDSLADSQLGIDVLCYVAVAALIQSVCPPKLLRHPSLLLVLVLLATVLIEFSSTAIRTMLNHESVAAGTSDSISLQWAQTAAGNGLYTALLAVLPLTAINMWNSQMSPMEGRAVGNRWHRLTS